MAQASHRGVRDLKGIFVAGALALTACSSADPAPLTRAGSHSPGASSPPTPGAPDPAGATPGTDAGPGSMVPPAPSGPPVTTDDTWADGKMLTKSVTIAAGATVTIAPGATVTAASGVGVTVLGTLTASSAAKHAKLTGAGWTGIIVGSGGTLKLDGVDIDAATTGLHINGGNAAATYDHGKLTSTVPFQLDKGSKLSTAHSSAVAGGTSQIDGAFVASYLDYDKGSNEGLQMSEATASMSIEDSILHGTGGGDYLVASGGTLLHFAYSTITGSHCPFHFNTLTKYEIDHVSVTANAYGSMLYNADMGPNVISNSNFETNGSHDIDQTAPNSLLTLDNVFLGSNNSTYAGGKATPGANVTVKNKPTAAIASAKPR